MEQSDSGDQQALVETELAGKLILHWGVEGGVNYEGGWRLPGGPCRPEGTVEYKKRALQTPFRCAGAGCPNLSALAAAAPTDTCQVLLQD